MAIAAVGPDNGLVAVARYEYDETVKEAEILERKTESGITSLLLEDKTGSGPSS